MAETKFSSVLTGVFYSHVEDPRIPVLVDGSFTGSVSIGAIGRKLPHLLMDLAHITDTAWQAVGYSAVDIEDDLGVNPHEQIYVDLFTKRKTETTFTKIEISLQNATSMWKATPVVKSWFGYGKRNSSDAYISQSVRAFLGSYHFDFTKELLEDLNVYTKTKLNCPRWLFRYIVEPKKSLLERIISWISNSRDIKPLSKESKLIIRQVYWTHAWRATSGEETASIETSTDWWDKTPK